MEYVALLTIVMEQLVPSFDQSEKHKDIIEMEGLLQQIKEILDGRSCDNSSQGNMISTIRKIACEVDNVIELYLLLKEKRDNYHFLNVLKPTNLMWAWAVKMASEIDALKLKIRQMEDYLTIVVNSVGQNRGVTDAIKDDCPARECTPCGKGKANILIGLTEDTQKLVGELIEGKNQSMLRTVSVVGMGGIGKTTLVGKLYTEPTVSNHFECCWWISVSRHFDFKNFLIAILQTRKATGAGKLKPGPLGDKEELELVTMVKLLLKERKYLVVLDDVWTQEAWDMVRPVFPDDKKGSRLVVTTRKSGLQTGAPGICHIMETLDDGQSRELFYQEASIKNDQDVLYPDILEKILKRCGGLPLAITVVAHKLRKKRIRENWETVFNQLCNMQGVLVQNIVDVLSLSYDSLSPDLRSCFLRACFFPEDHEIPSENLIYLWAAEGLLLSPCGGGALGSNPGGGGALESNPGGGIVGRSSAGGGATSMETLGESHLNTLVKNNLIQAAVMSSNEASVKRCKVHPLMRAFALSKAREELFFQSNISSTTRHCALVSSSSSSTSFVKALYLRSLFAFQPGGNIPSKQLKSICQFSKILKILYLEAMNIGKLPDDIGSLRSLKYLNLCQTGITSLPKSVKFLDRLLILDVRKNQTIRGIKVVRRLANLRNLLLDDSLEPFRLGSMNNLRTLGWVNFHHLEENDLQNMANLEVLKLVVNESSRFEDFAGVGLGGLLSLKLKIGSRSSLPLSAEMLSNMHRLEELHLKVRVPESESDLQHKIGSRVPVDRLVPYLPISILRSLCVEINGQEISGSVSQRLVYVKISPDT